MKSFTTIFKITLTVLFLITGLATTFAQTDDSLDCHFSELPDNQTLPEFIPVLKDTSLRIVLLFVQFADYDTDCRSRGSVGWSHWDSSQATIIERKYRYHHFWEMYFTS